MSKNVVLFASPKDGKISKTHLRIYTELKNRGIDVYSVDARTAKVLDENGKIEAIVGGSENKGKGFQVIEFDPQNTACVVSNGIVNKRACCDFVEDLEDMGVYVVNSLEGTRNARSKGVYDRICKKNKIPTPKTELISDLNSLDSKLEDFNFPVVCKTLTGSLGVGVFKVDKPALVKPIFQAIWKIGSRVRDEGMLIQEFIPNHGDIRTIVVGGEIIGSMKRIAPEGDFRNNFSQGGTVEAYELSPEEEEIVKKAAKASKCEICGVDHILAEDGKIYVIETNSCPGTDGFITVHADCIDRMADFVLRCCGSSTKITTLGYEENVEIGDCGKVACSLDTADRPYSIIDGENISVEDNEVSFDFDGKTISLPLYDKVTYTLSSGMQREVPVVKLNIKIGRKNIEGVPFEVRSRGDKTTKVLLARNVLSRGNFVINPSEKGILDEKKISRWDRLLDENSLIEQIPDDDIYYSIGITDEAMVALFAMTQEGKLEDKPITTEAIDELEGLGLVDIDGHITEDGVKLITSEYAAERLANIAQE